MTYGSMDIIIILYNRCGSDRFVFRGFNRWFIQLEILADWGLIQFIRFFANFFMLASWNTSRIGFTTNKQSAFFPWHFEIPKIYNCFPNCFLLREILHELCNIRVITSKQNASFALKFRNTSWLDLNNSS